MPYGIIKIDTVTFTDAGVDKSVSISGLVQNPTFSGNVTVTGTLSGVTVTGTTANFTSGNFTNISGGTHTITSGVFAAGSAASPSITFTGDLNTGIYSPGADQVAISTGGSGRLFVDASGNVGVKTSAPFQYGVPAVDLAHIQLTSQQYSILTFGGTAAATGKKYWRLISRASETKFQLQSVDDSGNNEATAIEVVKGTAQAIDNVQLHTNGSERLRITSAGLVGIGTSSPESALDVRNASLSQIIAGLNGGQKAVIGSDTSTGAYVGTLDNYDIKLITNSTVRAIVTSAGLVGIGTSSPSGLLHVAGQIYSSGTGYTGTNSPTLRLINSTATTGRTFGINSADAGAFQVFDASAGDATRLWLDSSGRVGINTTSPQELLHVNTGSSGGQVLRLSTNGADTGYLYQNSGAVVLGAYSTRILGFETNGTERARIDSSGRLLVGTSSGSYKFQINALGSGGFAFDDVSGTISNTFGTGGSLALRAQVASSSGGGEIYLGGSTRGDSNINSIVLSTANTERMKIGANGYIHASNTGSYYSTGTFHELSGNSATDASLLVGSFNTSKNHGNTSACLVVADYDSDYTDSNLFGGWNVTNNSWRILIRGNGNVENVNNSYGALSDVKLKKNIVNAGSQWDDIKALQVRKYNFKEGQTHTQIGLIAQEVELVSPGLVSESPDRDEDGNALGTVTKSVNYSVLYMKAVKALQEAMERIETLEAKVAALENS